MTWFTHYYSISLQSWLMAAVSRWDFIRAYVWKLLAMDYSVHLISIQLADRKPVWCDQLQKAGRGEEECVWLSVWWGLEKQPHLQSSHPVECIICQCTISHTHTHIYIYGWLPKCSAGECYNVMSTKKNLPGCSAGECYNVIMSTTTKTPRVFSWGVR